MTKPIARCWCGKKLITGIVDSAGDWFPFGFVNCPTHSCYYEKTDAIRFKKPVKRRKADGNKS